MNSKKSKTPRLANYDDGGGVVSAAAAAAVNDDVLMEILLWLPAKSLIRFKLVCKNWVSLISDDQFRRLHTLRRHKPQPSLLFCTSNSRFFYLNPIISGESNPRMMIPYSFSVPNPRILSSCNGLLLLGCDTSRTDYFVYNPTTKQSREIIVSNDRDYPEIEGLSLAFDPSKSPHYKIVCVKASRDRHTADVGLYQIEVYDSVSHTWNLTLEPFTDSRQIECFRYGVHCNNSIYCKSYDGVMYFDIDKNVIRYLPKPNCLRGFEFCSLQLQESNGRLYLFPKRVCGKAAFWELQGDDHHSHSWFLKYHGRYPGRFLMSPRWWITSVLRFISGSNGNEASTLVTHVPGKIRACSFDESSQELVDLTNQPFYDENSLQFYFRDVHQFAESLALV